MSHYYQKPLVCLEWFSGIGGLHYALCITGVPSSVAASFDINHLANTVYRHNFKQQPIAKNVEHLTAEYIDALSADVWLMSPPCQPYTQGGKQRDDQDMRAVGLLHLIDVLPKLRCRPKFFFLENVPFFEVSKCHEKLVQTLQQLDYDIEEYMIAPTDPAIGIPNRRKRYYLSARLGYLKEIYRFTLPEFSNSRALISSLSQLSLAPSREPRPLLDYISDTVKDTRGTTDSQYLVPADFIRAAKDFRFDIVQPTSASCATFTKAYGSKYVIGTGSFLQTKAFDLAFEPDEQEKLLQLGLRFFTPREIADLHAFPPSHPVGTPAFEFPPQLTLIQQYRLLGNSLNVKVVACLLARLLPEQPSFASGPDDVQFMNADQAVTQENR